MARQIPAIFKFRPKVHRNETETISLEGSKKVINARETKKNV